MRTLFILFILGLLGTAWPLQADTNRSKPAAQVSVINVNKATVQQLAEQLSGVGLNKAKAIVEYRVKFGPFENMADLREVSGIGPALVAANKAKIRFK
ncbi:MAG: helix-hairpin-helix domain-containing protein [Pseudomonadota bacterium]